MLTTLISDSEIISSSDNRGRASVNQNDVPSPSVLLTLILPPMLETRPFTMQRPNPVDANLERTVFMDL